ncbi:MAG TPA: hypothetical protein EYQ50_29185, partial [Verrucomicrobiales bacterium]|nr:hypothetical protein [Verrucomicrobiales bacterium]
MNYPLLIQSIVLGLMTSLLCATAGWVMALWTTMLPERFRNYLRLLAVINLMIPAFMVADAWLALSAGSMGQWIPLTLMSMKGAIFLLFLMYWPIPFLLIDAIWRRMNRTSIESDNYLRSWQLIRTVFLPSSLPALKTSSLIVMVLALNQFMIPVLFQVDILPKVIWVELNTQLDFAAAFIKCIPLVVLPVLLICFFKWTQLNILHDASFTLLGDGVVRGRLGNWIYRVSLIMSVSVMILAPGVPFMNLLGAAETWKELESGFRSAAPAIVWSFIFASGCATICLLIAAVGAKLRMAEWFWVFFFVPGLFIGIGAVILLNHPPVLIYIYQSMAVVLLVLCLRYVAIIWSPVNVLIRRIPREWMEFARLQTPGKIQLLRRVHLPYLFLPMSAGWYLVYLFCLWDVESLIMIIPPGVETLSMRIFGLLHYGHTGQVNALCLILIFLAAMPLLIWKLAATIRKRWYHFSRSTQIYLGLILIQSLIGGGCDLDIDDSGGLDSELFERGEVIGNMGRGAGQFFKPRSVTLDLQDQVFVADFTGRIQKFSPEGDYLKSWMMPMIEKGKPKGMCCHSDGSILLIEPHYSRVNHFDSSWSLIRQWGEEGKEPGHLLLPRGVAVNSKGLLFVTEYGETNRVQCFSSDGSKCLLTFGKTGKELGEFSRPEGICIDRKERIYVADSCNHRIQVFSVKGEFLESFGQPGSGDLEFSFPMDVEIDDEGWVFICDYGNNRIQVLDPQHRFVESIGSPGRRIGQFGNPWSMAINSRGDLYVADTMNHRLQKLIRRNPLKPKSMQGKLNKQDSE